MCGSTTLGGKLFFHAVVEEMGWSADDGDVEKGMADVRLVLFDRNLVSLLLLSGTFFSL